MHCRRSLLRSANRRPKVFFGAGGQAASFKHHDELQRILFACSATSKIPIVVTLERPVGRKGALPQEVCKHLDLSETFEKDFFDLCKKKKIKGYLGRLKKQQVIVAGCETDVCVLQSCLGLLSLGYEVYVVEELLFSSSRNVYSAIARMKAEGLFSLRTRASTTS